MTIGALVLISLIAACVCVAMHGFLWVCGALMVAAVGWFARFRSGEWLMRPSSRSWIVTVVVVAVLVRIACVLLIPYRPSADFRVYHEAGIRMSETWTLNVGASREAYRCFFPPGGVFSLGVMYALFGKHVLAAQLLNVVYASLTVLGVWFITEKLFGSKCARVASLMAALFPSTIFACMLLGAEVPEAFWLIAALCLYVGPVWNKRWIWAGLVCGLLLGIGSLIRPTYVLLPIPIALHLLLLSENRKKALATAAGILLGTVIVVAPWTYRNYRVTGGFLLISSNAGGNLYSANNPDADGAYTEKAWVYLFENCPDDLTIDRTGKTLAAQWILRNPHRFAALAAIKFGRFWCSDHEIPWWALEQTHDEHPELGIPKVWWELTQSASNGFYLACLLVCTGVLWTRREWFIRNTAWMVLPLLFAYFTSVHMVFESQGKYRYMLAPLLCVLVGMWVSAKPKSVSIPNSETQ